MKITLGLGLDGLKPNISPSTIGIKKVEPWTYWLYLKPSVA